MATYFVSSVDGNNADDGLSWANAKATIAGALSVATSAGDIIKVSHVHKDVLAADTTFTAGNHVSLIVVDRSNSDALAEMDGTNGYVGHTSNSYAVTFAGAYRVLWRGFYFLGSGSTAKSYTLGDTNNSDTRFKNCTFKLTANGNSVIDFGQAGANLIAFASLEDCTVVATVTTQRWCRQNNARIHLKNVTVSGTCRFYTVATRGNAFYAEGCDLSACSNAELISSYPGAANVVVLENCKLPASTTWYGANSNIGLAGIELLLYNCHSGDVHYHFGHYNPMGRTEAVTTYYADDGVTYDGTNRYSWKIVTTANCSIYTPYVSRWFATYHDGTSGITPWIEGLRVDSTTIIQNDEVAGEFSFQATSGFPISTFKDDLMTLLGSPANQTSSKTYADWTGSPTDTDSADSTFALASPSSTTPAEIGLLMGRVIVGEPSLTVYIDPQVRT